MKTVNVHEAKTHLSRIIEDVAAGEPVIIARAGIPVVRIVPLSHRTTKRTLGILKGKFSVGADCDAELPGDVLESFER